MGHFEKVAVIIVGKIVGLLHTTDNIVKKIFFYNCYKKMHATIKVFTLTIRCALLVLIVENVLKSFQV